MSDDIVAGTEAWAPLIARAELDCAVAGALAAVGGDAARLAPPLPLVLEALRWAPPEAVRVVVLGQDPYPTPGDACGLAFSTPPGAPAPPALRRVYGCVAAAAPPADGDLRHWAAQGVLLLNSALTTEAGVRGAHAGIWRPFVAGLLEGLAGAAAAAGRRLQFLLWGEPARALGGPVARRHGHAALEWTHPSPLADNALPAGARFRACPHFGAANAALAAAGLRPIVWSPAASVVAFTDGACAANGRAGARGGFAAVFAGGSLGGAVLRGPVPPRAAALRDSARPERGLVFDGAEVAPSNNRAELLGIVFALLLLCRAAVRGAVELVSDSLVALRTLTDWLPARLARGTERELSNFDLVWVAWRLLELLRAQAARVTLTHVRGHQTVAADAPARARLLCAGNAAADRHAAAGAAAAGLEAAGAPAVAAALLLAAQS